MPTHRNGPYAPHELPDGTTLTVEQQVIFRNAADMAHTVGLSEHHRLMAAESDDPRRPGDADWLWVNIEATREALRLDLPAYGDVITAALDSYLELGRQHENVEMCHHCSDTTFAAATPEFNQSGLNADLFTLLAGNV